MPRHHPWDDPRTLPQTAHSLTAGPAPATSSLEGAVAADVAVIGAGITGMSAALHLAEHGAKVVVLEANEIGWGASGRSFGQVVPYLRHEADQVLVAFGNERGGRMVAAAAGAPDLVFGLIERHAIACDPVREGLLFAAHTPAALRLLERRRRFWQDRAVDLSWLDVDAAKAAIGGGAYWGAVLDDRGGTINSLAYTRGLAQAAIDAGATIYTDSRVVSQLRDGRDWVLGSAKGTVTADRLLVCTNAYSGGLWPELAASIVPVRGYQFLSRPLPGKVWRSILPGNQALTDTRQLMSGVRKVPGRRLQVSGGIGFSGPERIQPTQAVTRRVGATFPQAGAIEWEACWSGFVAMTPDEYPRLHRLGPGAMAGLGYSGRGLALATLFGRELARWAAGASVDDLAFPVTKPVAIRSPAAARVGARGLGLLYRAEDALAALRYGRGPVRARRPRKKNETFF